jgi:zinc transport system substrate-binding protein
MGPVPLALTLFTLFSCGGPPAADEPGAVRVAVSIAPQEYFVSAVGGDLVTVDVVVPPGFSPATYEPTADDLRRLSSADVYFTVGVPFEDSWLPRITGAVPGLTVVPSHRGIQRMPVDRHPGGGHDHHGHDHGAQDPHVWLSPELVTTIVRNISSSLTEIDPPNSQAYSAGRDSLLAEIVLLQSELHGLLDPVRGKAFMVFHPSWGYFADEFGLVQIAIESEGSEPSPAVMAELVDMVSGHDIGVIFVSPQFSDASARTIADQTGTEVAVLDPLAPDWADNLLEAAALIAGGSAR